MVGQALGYDESEHSLSQQFFDYSNTLPSSTPHWSKLLMPQRKPCTATRCSYSASSCPHVRGVSAGNSSDSDGRLPGNSCQVRCGGTGEAGGWVRRVAGVHGRPAGGSDP